jgi:site-specific recombinase XerD
MSATVIPLRPDQPRKPRTRRRKPPTVPEGAPLDALLESYQLHLQAANKAAKTVENYTRSAQLLIAFLASRGYPHDSEGITAEHIQDFLVHERERTSARTAQGHWSNLRVWFNWMIRDDERTGANPVRKEDKPKVDAKAGHYLTEDQIRALRDTCAPNTFIGRRDRAIILILADNGVRVGGLTGIRYTPHDPETNDVYLKEGALRIRLKGGAQHFIPIGKTAVAALDKYLRIRASHPHADQPSLWLGAGGRNIRQVGTQAIRSMLKRRGEIAGVPGVHPHKFRGTTAHMLLKNGADVTEVQSILGWKTLDMVLQYTKELAAERARETHARLSPADRL